jgi:hypothetical protein
VLRISEEMYLRFNIKLQFELLYFSGHYTESGNTSFFYTFVPYLTENNNLFFFFFLLLLYISSAYGHHPPL